METNYNKYKPPFTPDAYGSVIGHALFRQGEILEDLTETDDECIATSYSIHVLTNFADASGYNEEMIIRKILHGRYGNYLGDDDTLYKPVPLKVVEEGHYFQVELKAHIELSDDEFKYLMDCFRNHYDSTIKSAVEVGGFMYGFRNRRAFSDGEDKQVQFSDRQLNLAIKSLEFVNGEMRTILNKRLWKIVREMHEHHISINNKLKPDSYATK